MTLDAHSLIELTLRFNLIRPDVDSVATAGEGSGDCSLRSGTWERVAPLTLERKEGNGRTKRKKKDA